MATITDLNIIYTMLTNKGVACGDPPVWSVWKYTCRIVTKDISQHYGVYYYEGQGPYGSYVTDLVLLFENGLCTKQGLEEIEKLKKEFGF